MEKTYLKLKLCEARLVNKAPVKILKLSGEVDLASYSDLTEFLKYHLGLNDWPLVIDLDGVTFMDSTGGLRLLLSAADVYGFDRLAIVNANENIKRLFQFANLANSFSLYPNLGQAIKALSVSNDTETSELNKSA